MTLNYDQLKASNNASTTLYAGITAADTSLQVAAGDGILFEEVSGGDEHEFLTIEEDGVGIEIVKVTAHSSFFGSPDTFTIQRAQQGTNPLAFTTAATVEARPTAQHVRRSVWQERGRHARNFINSIAANSDFDIYARREGPRGESISFEMVDPAAPSSPLSVNVTAFAISVSLETDGGSALISTANDVAAAIRAEPKANKLIRVDVTGGDGTGVVDAYAQQTLGQFQSGIGVGEKSVDISPSFSSSESCRGDYAVAIGAGSNALANYSIVIGSYADENADPTFGAKANIVIGTFSATSSASNLQKTICIGYSSNVGGTGSGDGTGAIAIGKDVEAQESYSIVIGANTTNAGPYNIHIGEGHTPNSSNYDTICIGRSLSVPSSTNTIMIGGNGGTTRQSNKQDCIGIGRGGNLNSGNGMISVGYCPSNGPFGVAIGFTCRGTTQAVSIGYNAYNRTFRGVTIGYNAQTRGYYAESFYYRSVAIGAESYARNNESIAIGPYAYHNVEGAAQIRGPIIVARDRGVGRPRISQYAGAETILMSPIYDFTSPTPFTGGTANNANVMLIPGKGVFYPNEVGLLTYAYNTLTVGPTLAFGWGGTTTYILAPTTFAVPTLAQAGGYAFYAAANRRGVGPSLPPPPGYLSIYQTIPATATTFTGRLYWKGFMVEVP